MRAPADLLPLAAALCAGIALGACGDGLYDATGVPVLEGSGLSCDAGLVDCGGVCTQEDAAHCATAAGQCQACPATAAGQPACLREGATATCGYECTDGLLKCATGCCETAALAAGDAHTCALLAGGEVACWGANGSGQVGDGTTAPRLAPRRVALPEVAVALAAGVSHSCAVLASGAVRCWGANDAGQVTGTAGGPVLSPAAVAGISGAKAIAAGRAHTCALLEGGAVRCWGSNGLGQLGPGGQPIATGEGTTALVAGRDHACALVAGQVRCWGSNASGQLGATASGGIAVPIAAGIAHLAAGGDQTCAATGTSRVNVPDDALRCWGASVGAGWGLGETEATPAIPLKKVDPPVVTVDYDVTMLAAGGHHVCLQKKTESVECLGADLRGQLGGTLTGPGETASVPLPPRVPETLPAAAALAAGAAHACAATGDGRLRCWGANEAGQLGDGTTVDAGKGVLATPLGR